MFLIGIRLVAGLALVGLSPALAFDEQVLDSAIEVDIALVDQRSCSADSRDGFYEVLGIRQRLRNRSKETITLLVGSERVLLYEIARTQEELAAGRVEFSVDLGLTPEEEQKTELPLWPGESFEKRVTSSAIAHRPQVQRFGGSIPVGPHVFRFLVEGRYAKADGTEAKFRATSNSIPFSIPAVPSLQICRNQ